MSALIPAVGTVLRKSEGCESSWFGRDYVILDPMGRTLHGLNRTAARVWELADGYRSISQISTEIAAQYSLPVDQVLKDVLSFGEQLLKLQLAVQVDQEGTAK